MKPPIIIVAAPSGAGKSSFVERICQELPELVDAITYTTRTMRPGEAEGNPYHFTSEEDFKKKVEAGFFVEWAYVHSNWYGTPLDQLEQAWSQDRSVIMDVDIQGAKTLKERYPASKSIFILPPSIDELRRRVKGRPGGEPPDMEIRMKNAQAEIKEAGQFDYQLVNDEFETSYQKFKKVIEGLVKGL